MLVGRDAKKLESVASELKGSTFVAAGDITKEEDVKAIFVAAIAKFGTVDVVVNTAGILNYGVIGELEPSQWWADHVSLPLHIPHSVQDCCQQRNLIFIETGNCRS